MALAQNTAATAPRHVQMLIDGEWTDSAGGGVIVVENPGKYGFLNSTQACYSGFVLPDPSATICADPDQYVFWDVEHPTTRFHEILADEMLAAVTAVPEPSGLAPLALGLAALGLIRRTAGRRGIAARD